MAEPTAPGDAAGAAGAASRSGASGSVTVPVSSSSSPCASLVTAAGTGGAPITAGATGFGISPAQGAVAIASLNRTRDVFADDHRSPGAGANPLRRRQLEVPVVVAHHPVVRDGPFLFESKDGVEAKPARAAKSSAGVAASAKRALWSAQYSASR